MQGVAIFANCALDGADGSWLQTGDVAAPHEEQLDLSSSVSKNAAEALAFPHVNALSGTDYTPCDEGFLGYC